MQGSSPTLQVIDNSSSQHHQPATNHVKFFAGDLSFFCTEKDLHQLFSPFGHVQSIHIPRTAAHDESLMHGFVHLEPALQFTPEEIVNALNGQEYMGRHLCVQISSHNGQRNPISKDHLIQVHMSFISKQADYIVDEAVLRKIFAAFGEVADISIKKHAFMMPQNFQSGYGFVYFHDVSTAQFVVAVLKGKRVDDVTIDCSMSFRTDILMQNQGHGRSHREPRNNHASAYSVQAMALVKGEEARRFRKHQQLQQQQQNFHRHDNNYHQHSRSNHHYDNHQFQFASEHRGGPRPFNEQRRQYYEDAVRHHGYQCHQSHHDEQQQQQRAPRAYYHHQGQSQHSYQSSNSLHQRPHTAAAPLFIGEFNESKYNFFSCEQHNSISTTLDDYQAFGFPVVLRNDIFKTNDTSSPPIAWLTSPLASPTLGDNAQNMQAASEYQQREDDSLFTTDLFSSLPSIEHSSSSGSGTTEETFPAWRSSSSYSIDNGFSKGGEDYLHGNEDLLQQRQSLFPH